MTLPAGSRLGPYEIVELIGLGGMGEVHRARDTRLSRDVAVKVLPSSMCEDKDRLRRFEQEAWAAGLLNHPNVLAVYDIGTHEGVPYVVTELLQGESLRARLESGALPVRKALDYAVQAAHGLAAAHDKGIVHRDLKPENLFVTRDGRLKLLDFGLAKQFRLPLADASPDGATVGRIDTEPGVVLGTVGYLSPEQARGLGADHRSDIFAMGAVLYEMLTGRQPFKKETSTDTLAAILREDPPPLGDHVPVAIQKIVLHCLEKDPDQRFQSALDAAFHLETLSTPTGPSSLDASLFPVPSRRRRLDAAGVAAAVLALGIGLGWGLGVLRSPEPPRYRQITYQRGHVSSARFAPDGETIVFSAAWQGRPQEVFVGRASGSDFRPLGLEAEVLAVSSRDELAIALRPRQRGLATLGTLARVPLAGGQPRELVEDVYAADWSPDGNDLAVARRVEGGVVVEYPIGTSIHRAEGWIGHLRVSPRGDDIAFVEYPATEDDRGAIRIVSRSGETRGVSRDWSTARGVAWRGRDVWVAAAVEGVHRALYAVARNGRDRLLARVPGAFSVCDVGRDGRVLAAHGGAQGGLVARGPDDADERDVSWLDWSVATDIAADGRSFLFHEAGEGTRTFTTFLGQTAGGLPVRLTEGQSVALSPDARRALVIVGTQRDLTLVPTGAGESRSLALGSLELREARFLPDGLGVVLLASDGGKSPRLHLLDLASGQVRALSDEDVHSVRIPVSPDGRWVAANTRDGGIRLHPLAGGASRLLPGTETRDQPMGWAGPEAVLVGQSRPEATDVYRVEVATGTRTAWRRLAPPDPAGIIHVGSQVFSPDGRAYVYSYVRARSELFVVEGVR